MTRVSFITPAGDSVELDVTGDGSLMQAARDNDVPGIDGDCGGCMVCGTCRVVIEPVWNDRLPAQSAAELEILENAVNTEPFSRLTCQIHVSEALEGIVLRIPERQR
jgi:2Fe-2S ferredoxin